MMCIQDKNTFKKTMLGSGILVCLFLAGCGDRSYYPVHPDLKNGLYDSAISDFNKAIEIDPKHDKAYNSRGNVYNVKGLFDLAISDFNEAIDINPKYADAYGNRGYAYSAKGLYDLAISDFNKAIAPYKLSRTEISELKTKLLNVRPPSGLKGFDDPILGRDT